MSIPLMWKTLNFSRNDLKKKREKKNHKLKKLERITFDSMGSPFQFSGVTTPENYTKLRISVAGTNISFFSLQFILSVFHLLSDLILIKFFFFKKKKKIMWIQWNISAVRPIPFSDSALFFVHFHLGESKLKKEISLDLSRIRLTGMEVYSNKK